MDKIDRWDTEDRVYRDLWNGLIAYGQGTKMEYNHYTFSYGGETKIVNKNIDYKTVKFPDGREVFPLNLDRTVDQFSKWYILYDDVLFPTIEYTTQDGKAAKQWHSYAHIKINGLIARYTKDEDGAELKLLNHIHVSADEKYLFVQRKIGEPYYMLDQHFSYMRDQKSQKLSFQHLPFYVDGVFLSYDNIPWDTNSFYKDLMLTKAYFEDGTLVGEEAPQLDTTASVWLGAKKEIYKALK